MNNTQLELYFETPTYGSANENGRERNNETVINLQNVLIRPYYKNHQAIIKDTKFCTFHNYN